MHPFYSISKVVSKLKITGSERHIIEMKSKWMDSISDVTKDPTKLMFLVNGTHIGNWSFWDYQESNPYRLLYLEIVSYARMSLGERLFYFYPMLDATSLFARNADVSLLLAEACNSGIIYNPKTISITAYGEHVDEENQAGCVDSNVRALIEALRITKDRVTIDSDRSLPLQPIIKTEFGYDVPSTMYLTARKLRSLSENQ